MTEARELDLALMMADLCGCTALTLQCTLSSAVQSFADRNQLQGM